MVQRKQKKYLVQEANEMWVISNDAICGPMSLPSRELEGKARGHHTDFLGLIAGDLEIVDEPQICQSSMIAKYQRASSLFLHSTM